MRRAGDADPARASGWRRHARSAYLGGVWAKGIHGGLDVATGVVLLIIPQLLPTGVLWGAEEAGDLGGTPANAVSGLLHAIGADLLSWPGWLLGAFLLLHGCVKLASAYCLLRRVTRGYPWAIGALCALFVYQVVDAALAASITMTALAVIDAVIIAIVILEYHHLRQDGRHPRAVDAAHTVAVQGEVPADRRTALTTTGPEDR